MKKMLFLACMALTLAACEKDPDMNQLDADLVVYTDHDNNAAFDGYKTYFLPDSILEAGGYKASYWKDENAKALVDAVAQQMDGRGYTRLTDPEKKDQPMWRAALIRGTDESCDFLSQLWRMVGLWFLGSLVGRLVLSVSRELFLRHSDHAD